MFVHIIMKFLAASFSGRHSLWTAFGNGILTVVILLFAVSVLLTYLGVYITPVKEGLNFFGKFLHVFGALTLYVLRMIPKVIKAIFRNVYSWFTDSTLSDKTVKMLAVMVTIVILIIL